MTYKLNGQKYKYNVSSDKESKFQSSPFPVSSNMNSQMVRGLAGCAMSKCKTFLQKLIKQFEEKETYHQFHMSRHECQMNLFFNQINSHRNGIKNTISFLFGNPSFLIIQKNNGKQHKDEWVLHKLY